MLDKNIFIEMILAGLIIDGRAGGLVVGRSHAAGNIYTLTEVENKFICPLSLEGGEYLINKRSYNLNKDIIEEINSFKEPHVLPPVETNSLSRIINTAAEPNDKIIFVDFGQFIVNKNATARHYQELEEINNDSNRYIHCHIEDTLLHALANYHK